jgi:hypothetical protein
MPGLQNGIVGGSRSLVNGLDGSRKADLMADQSRVQVHNPIVAVDETQRVRWAGGSCGPKLAH